jgi:hypothetical protein
MNRLGQLEMDMEMLLAIALGIATGMISMYVMKSSPLNGFWKIMTFILSSIAGWAVSYFIFTRD